MFHEVAQRLVVAGPGKLYASTFVFDERSKRPREATEKRLAPSFAEGVVYIVTRDVRWLKNC